MRLLRLNKDRLDLTEFAEDVRNGFAAGLRSEFADVFDDIDAREREKLSGGNDEHGENMEEREEAECTGPINDSACAEDSEKETHEDTPIYEAEESVEEVSEDEKETSVENDVNSTQGKEVSEFGANFDSLLKQLEDDGRVYERVPVRGLQGYLRCEE